MIIACVRTGTAYPFEYVTKLRNMVKRHCPRDYTMVCLTDQPERCDGDVVFIDISQMKLPGWWGKMMLFEPTWRERHKVVYLDLDTVIIRDIGLLGDVPGEFAILDNYTRKAVNPSYPCRYNSSVMVIGGGMAGFVWTKFERNRHVMIRRHDRYGDQACIEELVPEATLLQTVLPPKFFMNYRLLTMAMPKLTAIINFGGKHKPHVCDIPWVMQEWR